MSHHMRYSGSVAFPGSAGPFVTPSTSPYQKSGSAASVAGFGADASTAPSVTAAPPVSPGAPLPALKAPAPERPELPKIETRSRSAWDKTSYFIGLGSSIAGVYHGYKRNNGSIGWALAWGLVGGIWPVAIPLMLAQGFAKPIGPKSDGK